VARELFRRFDAAHRTPGHPEGTAAEADGRILGHLDLEFTVERVRTRDGRRACTYPDESSADGYGALTNGTGFDSGNKVAALTVNSLYGAVAFIVNPDRSLSHG